jgi:hypothetical protein
LSSPSGVSVGTGDGVADWLPDVVPEPLPVGDTLTDARAE